MCHDVWNSAQLHTCTCTCMMMCVHTSLGVNNVGHVELADVVFVTQRDVVKALPENVVSVVATAVGALRVQRLLFIHRTLWNKQNSYRNKSAVLQLH